MGNKFRSEIEKLIETENLDGLLGKAAELHGHYCNYLAYGVIAGVHAIKKLDIVNTGMEEIIAVTETNNCFSDGIQMVTGCTFGNNSLIYRDYGKTAAAVMKRNGNGIRLVMKPSFENSREEAYPEAYVLFNRLIKDRKEGTPEEYQKMMKLFAEMSVKELHTPVQKIFDIKKADIELPGFAPIFETVKCDSCGENVIKSRIVEEAGRKLCFPCAGADYFELNGSGIEQKG